MAQRVNVVLVDDIDGSDATETVSFGLDGVDYEIDLSDEHAAELREAVACYIGHARRTGGRRRSGAALVGHGVRRRRHRGGDPGLGPRERLGRPRAGPGQPPRSARRTPPPTDPAGPVRSIPGRGRPVPEQRCSLSANAVTGSPRNT